MKRYALRLVFLLGFAGCERTATPPGAPTATSAPAPAAVSQVRAALDAFAGTIRKANTFSVDLSSTFRISRDDKETNMESALSLAVRRPDQAAIRVVRGMMAADLIADGHDLYARIPSVNKYSQEPQTGDLQTVADMDTTLTLAVVGPVGFCVTMLGDDIARDILDEANAATDLGQETLEGQPTHRLHFEQDQYDWDLWLAGRGDPLPVRIKFDFSKSMGEESESAQAKKAQASIVVEFTHWKINPDLPVDAFKFVPPDGAQKVANLFESREDDNPMLGLAAPPLQLRLLEGGTVDLAQHKGKDIVILDFWATWCDPCIRALPVLQQVTRALSGQGVVLYAINQQEEPAQIRSFFNRRQDLKLAVALDPDGKAGNSYQVQGIPRSVIIGKDGRVQSIHEGYSPSLRRRLRRELRSLLAGKDLASAKRTPASGPTVTSQPIGMRQVWNVDGGWDSVAADSSSGAIVAVSSRGPAVQIAPDGKILREFKLAHPGGIVRLGNLTGDSSPEMVTFDFWGGAITAHSAGGDLLWAFPGGGGVNDVCLADLNGDGLCEAIVGYNGAAGLQAVSSTGKPLWKNTEVGKVRHVSAGPLGADSRIQIVGTSDLGLIHVFKGDDGTKLKDLQPGFFATMVRVQQTSDGSRSPFIVAGGTGDSSELLAYFDAEGNRLAAAALERKGGYIDSTACATKSPWAAVGLRGGTVKVFATNGQMIAQTFLNAQRVEVAWSESGPQPLLLVATGHGVVSFAIEPNTASGPESGAASKPVL